MARQHDQQRRSPSSVASPPDDFNEGGGTAASDVKRATPPPPQTRSKKSNNSNNNVNVITSSSSRTHPEMVVDARVLDELLLVCSVIGSTTLITDPITGGTREEFVPVTDCLNWLQDLQRALRRDHETYRPVSLKLGQWKVVCQKLLPLVMSCRYDSGLVMTVCKILVILTKPLSEAAINAGRLTIDIKNKKNSERSVGCVSYLPFFA
jgi:timeless